MTAPDRRARRDGDRSIAVADQLREAILSGEMPPAQRVNEVHLARELGLSRTPVRAALHALGAEGLLDYEPNRGFTVRDCPAESVADAYEIRAVLEGLACRFAAQRGIPEAEEAVFRRALEEGDAVVDGFTGAPEQIAAYREVNMAFHDAVIRCARAEMLADAIRLPLRRPGATLRNIVEFTLREVRRRHDDHHRIHEALLAGEGCRAEMLMREHVCGIRNSRLRALGSGRTGD